MNKRAITCVLTGLAMLAGVATLAGCGEENPSRIPTTAPANGADQAEAGKDATNETDAGGDAGDDLAKSFTATLLITEASTAPDPQEAAYDDAILAFEAEVLSAEAGGPAKGESVGVYVLAMRDRNLLEPANWFPTKEVTVQVLPWRDAKQRMPELKPMYVIDELSSVPQQVWFVLPAK